MPAAECLLPHARTHTHTHTRTHTPDGNESTSDLFQQRHVVIRPLSPAFHISNWQRRQMKPNETKRHQRHQRHKMTPDETIHTKRQTSANDTHIAWNKFWILPCAVICRCPFVRAPFPATDMNCIPPARPPPHILAPSRPEPASTRTHTHTHTHTHTRIHTQWK